MWPWGHAAVGYLLYALLVRSNGRTPAGSSVIALGLGTQFPDLVDKPLGWTLGLLPGGRSLAHSLLTLTVLAAVLWYVGHRYRRQDLTFPFLFGSVSHVLSDGLYAALEGNYGDLSYLLWPVLPVPEADVEQSFLAHFAELTLSSTVTFEIVLFVAATVIWVVDGAPGLWTLHAAGKEFATRLASDG
ncbi:metal-dependent hydrolase [Haloarcula marina]|uniref:metal-dependent hydrolase n=1 Tax=Haloarcula marina TaxID=2961574 RepID=UPI0020B7E7D2|nr:metal-dependent hydrolase [Halomicroarcula marina]